MKKRILSLFFALIMIFSLVACGEREVPATDSSTLSENKVSSTDSSTSSENETSTTDSEAGSESELSTESSSENETNTDTDTGTDSESSDEVVEITPYDPSLEHKIIACDIRNRGIVVFDLNVCDGDLQNLTQDSAVVWEWRSEEDPNCKGTSKIKASISGVKYRYSEYYKKDVVVACATYGWVGIIDYETRSVLWESTSEILSGVHSVEMLPNGDVVAGGSKDPDGGAIVYFSVSSGKTTPVHYIPGRWCHGLCWDPVNECLWSLEIDGVFAIAISDMGTENAKVVRMNGSGEKFDDYSGHAFAPVAGEPGKYWASAGGLWIFDSETEEFTRAGAPYASGSIKGMCSFADGTVVQAIAGLCGTNRRTFGSDGFRIITKQLTAGNVKKVKDVVTVVHFTEREFYKVQAFTKDYQ